MPSYRATKALWAVLGYAANAGVPPPELLLAVDLDPSLLELPDIDLSHARELLLWEEAALRTSDEAFGLHLAEWLAPLAEQQFDVLAIALRSCKVLRDYFCLCERYTRLVHAGVRCSLVEEANVACVVHSHHEEPNKPPRHPSEGFLALLVLHGRRVAGEDLAPQEVCFEHPRPSDVSEHERIFRAPVRFDCPRTELVFDRALLARPHPFAEPRLLELLSRLLEADLSKVSEKAGFLGAVRRQMLDELPNQEPCVATISRRMHMSPRSLQRRLHSEGTSFAAVLSGLRGDLALSYLRDDRLTIGEVAFLLGFLDVTAFHRAFKRWTATTPAEYRRSARAGKLLPG